ncbi:MAG: CopD family protein [Thauera sp.]|nr:CopD family protein [Thauera sp.]
MPWLKVFHFAALLMWCGLLLHLPSLLRAAWAPQDVDDDRRHVRQAHLLFIGVATPAALLAIASGTVLFVREEVMTMWLVAKLAAVSGMVCCHAACGAILLRLEREPPPALRLRWVAEACRLGAATFIGTTLWLVLAKPF